LKTASTAGSEDPARAALAGLLFPVTFFDAVFILSGKLRLTYLV
jgi:hypothetical protein